MSGDQLDLDAVADRYTSWHGADNDTPGGAQFWPDGDPDESMSHYIVRNDVPALVAEVRRLREKVEVVERVVQGKAIGANQYRPEEERRWLDLLAIMERL